MWASITLDVGKHHPAALGPWAARQCPHIPRNLRAHQPQAARGRSPTIGAGEGVSGPAATPLGLWVSFGPSPRAPQCTSPRLGTPLAPGGAQGAAAQAAPGAPRHVPPRTRSWDRGSLVAEPAPNSRRGVTHACTRLNAPLVCAGSPVPWHLLRHRPLTPAPTLTPNRAGACARTHHQGPAQGHTLLYTSTIGTKHQLIRALMYTSTIGTKYVPAIATKHHTHTAYWIYTLEYPINLSIPYCIYPQHQSPAHTYPAVYIHYSSKVYMLLYAPTAVPKPQRSLTSPSCSDPQPKPPEQPSLCAGG